MMIGWTDERLRSAREMEAEGRSPAEIAEALGTSRGAVSGLLSRLQAANDAERLSRSMWTREAETTLEQLAAKGYSATMIMRELGSGFTRNMVIGRARRRGIKLGGVTGVHLAPKGDGATEKREPRKRHIQRRPPPASKPAPGGVTIPDWVAPRYHVLFEQWAKLRGAAKAIDFIAERMRRAGLAVPGHVAGGQLPDVPLAPPPASLDCEGVDLMGLKPSSCRWPIGDPRSQEFRFCGNTKFRGSYCRAHHAQAHVPPAQRRDAEKKIAAAGTFFGAR